MYKKLPAIADHTLELAHFPTRHQAFLFRASEFLPISTMAQLLETDEVTVRNALQEMGLQETSFSEQWRQRGYITIIRQLWPILPYDQLLQVLEMTEEELALILKEDDFLAVKLSEKPACEPVKFHPLTAEESRRTQEIKAIMEKMETDGVAPFDFHYDVQKMQFSGAEQVGLRMVYCFSGLYQHAFDVDSREYCPDELLEAYQKVGINALWTQGILYQLAPYPFDEKVSEGYEQRIARVKDFAKRCEKYGIKLFLYLNEPRSMPHDFFDKYPHLRGQRHSRNRTCMCTSTKEVQDYITDSVEYVCRQVPEIGGFFTITRSENPTNCFSHYTRENSECPRCRQRKESEVIAEVINCMLKGIRKVSSDIKLIAWSWGWRELNLDIINALPKGVILMAQSERNVPFEIGGVKGSVVDYSMSVIGPAKRAMEEWEAAQARGLECAAKVQINTTWEASTVPAIPVYPLTDIHIQRLQDVGIRNLLLSWTLGGYPSRNIMHVSKYFYEHLDNEEVLYQSETERQAAEYFSEAFKEFPFDVGVLYFGPQNAGPASPLYLKPTGFGATMTCYAYDDIEKWRSIYPEDVFEAQLYKLCRKWEQGLDLLPDVVHAESEMAQMAHGTYYLFRASLNQFRFYRARAIGDTQAMVECAKQESETARNMLMLMNKNAAIGYEAANHYYFSKGSMYEKIINCSYVMEQLQK